LLLHHGPRCLLLLLLLLPSGPCCLLPLLPPLGPHCLLLLLPPWGPCCLLLLLLPVLLPWGRRWLLLVQPSSSCPASSSSIRQQYVCEKLLAATPYNGWWGHKCM
jgi:hypothetical protein